MSSCGTARKMRYALLMVSVGVLLLTATFGMKMVMMDDGDTAMADCPFMETGSLCQMTVAEHLRVWESLFVSVTHPEFLLALLLVVAVTIGFVSLTLTGPPRFMIAVDQYRRRPDFALFKPLSLAFSDGIIQPKLYS